MFKTPRIYRFFNLILSRLGIFKIRFAAAFFPLFFAAAVFSCVVTEEPVPAELHGRVTLSSVYSGYKVYKIHINDDQGNLLGSADPYEVETTTGTEIHWNKKIDIPDNTLCTMWVEFFTPANNRMYYNEGRHDIITAGTFYDLTVTDSQLPLFTENDIKKIGTDDYPMSEKYVLIRDIVLSGDWEPIAGNSLTPFTGTFNGDFHTIRGLKLSGGNRNMVGFFGFVKGTYRGNAVVKNLFLYINDQKLILSTTSGQDVGIVAAYAEDAIFDRISVYGGVGGLEIEKLGGVDLCVGGIVGEFGRVSAGRSSITSCAAEIPISINVTGNATTSVKNYYGGIAGRIFRDGGTDRFVSVDKCYVNKLLSAVSPYDIYGGGILGLYHDKFSDSSVDDEFAGLEISECYNTGDISATGESVFCGGILGDALGTKGNKAKINMTIKGNMAFNVEIIIASTTTPSGVNRISGGENWTWSDPNKFKNYGLSEMTLIGLDGGVEGLPVLRTQINRIWFVNLNWDFASTWQWDDSLKRPVFQWR